MSKICILTQITPTPDTLQRCPRWREAPTCPLDDSCSYYNNRINKTDSNDTNDNNYNDANDVTYASDDNDYSDDSDVNDDTDDNDNNDNCEKKQRDIMKCLQFKFVQNMHSQPHYVVYIKTVELC